MAKLTVVATLVARPGLEDELGAALRALIAPTRAEQGCLAYELHRSHEQPNTYVFTESWADRAVWDAHMQTPHLQNLAAQQETLAERWELFVGEPV